MLLFLLSSSLVLHCYYHHYCVSKNHTVSIYPTQICKMLIRLKTRFEMATQMIFKGFTPGCTSPRVKRLWWVVWGMKYPNIFEWLQNRIHPINRPNLNHGLTCMTQIWNKSQSIDGLWSLWDNIIKISSQVRSNDLCILLMFQLVGKKAFVLLNVINTLFDKLIDQCIGSWSIYIDFTFIASCYTE